MSNSQTTKWRSCTCGHHELHHSPHGMFPWDCQYCECKGYVPAKQSEPEVHDNTLGKPSAELDNNSTSEPEVACMPCKVGQHRDCVGCDCLHTPSNTDKEGEVECYCGCHGLHGVPWECPHCDTPTPKSSDSEEPIKKLPLEKLTGGAAYGPDHIPSKINEIIDRLNATPAPDRGSEE